MPKRRRQPAAEGQGPDDFDTPSDDEQPEQQSDDGSRSGTSSDSAVTDGSEKSAGGEEDDTTSMDEEVEVDIEFFDPKEADFHGIKILVEDVLGGAPFNASRLADAIIGQSSVGTVVKSGEDEDPIGVVSPLNLQRYRDLEALQQIGQHLLEHCSDAKRKQQLSTALQDPGTGLLVNERLVNAPPQVAPPLMQALFDEISWAVEDEPTKERQDSFRFTQYLMIASAYRDPQAATEEAAQRPAKPAKKRPKLEPLVYVKPEDEFFHKHCSWSFTFSTPKEGAAAEDLQPLRLVMLVTSDQAAAVRKELDEVVGNMARC